MSAVYKVLADMQKTQPRGVRGNRIAMLVLGSLIVVGMFMVVASIRQPLTGVKTDDRNHPRLKMPVAKYGHRHCHGPGPALIVSLSPQGEWVEVNHGTVSEDRLREIMIERRDQFQREGWSSRVVVRIGAEQPAHYLKRIHQISQECEMDELSVSAWTGANY